MRPRDGRDGGPTACAARRSAAPCTRCSSTSTCRAGARARLEERVRAGYPRATDEELERIRGSSRRTATRSSRPASPRCRGVANERHFTFEHDGVLLHGFLDVVHRADGGRSSSTTRRTRSRDGRRRRSSTRTYRCSGSSTRSRASARAPRRSRSSTSSSSGPTSPSSTTFTRAQRARARGRALRRDRAIRAGEFRPDAERVRLRRLPRARRRVRRAEAAVPAGSERRRRGARVGATVRSFVAEAPRAASARSACRIRPIIERLAREHADATIALRFGARWSSSSR